MRTSIFERYIFPALPLLPDKDSRVRPIFMDLGLQAGPIFAGRNSLKALIFLMPGSLRVAFLMGRASFRMLMNDGKLPAGCRSSLIFKISALAPGDTSSFTISP